MAKKQTNTNNAEFGGKLPPQSIELEEVVLGAILIEKRAINEIVEVLSPESFYSPKHSIIYQACLNLYNRSEPIDLLTVTQELKSNNKLESVGGAYGISQITNRVAGSGNIQFHARIIQQQFIKRELIRISSQTISLAYENETDSLELLDQYQRDAAAIEKMLAIGNFKTIKTEVKNIIDRNDELLSKSGISGVASGMPTLDKITGGWQKSDLIIIAARPGMGKTSLALALARNAAVDFGVNAVVFSLEMSSHQLTARLCSMETEIPLENFLRKGLKPHELTSFIKNVNPLISSTLVIDDTASISSFELKVKARKLKREKNIGLIVIDYLQLMTSGTNNSSREQEISYISRSLKALAKDLEVPIIALSQLSRACEARADKIPILSDLRESGSIEQDADMVAFLYRPEYYGFMTDDHNNSTVGKAMFMIAKHRNGGLENVPMRFQHQFTKFSDIRELKYSEPDSPKNNFSANPDF